MAEQLLTAEEFEKLTNTYIWNLEKIYYLGFNPTTKNLKLIQKFKKENLVIEEKFLTNSTK